MSRVSTQPVPLVDAFYEWLLSDALAAKGERARRRSRNTAAAERERAQVTAWCRRTLDLDNERSPAQLLDLAGVMQRLVVRGAARDLVEAGVPDDEWVRRERRQYEASRRVVGDHDYRYPSRYLGREAANQPVPDERVPVHVLAQGQGVRLRPSEPPVVVAAVEACSDLVLVRTADGQRRRYPAAAWAYRVHDERYVPDAIRDVSNAEPRLRRHRSDNGLER